MPQPAAQKAPLDYLFAILVSATVVGTSFLVEPPETKYVVLITGVVMLIASVAAALRPARSADTKRR